MPPYHYPKLALREAYSLRYVLKERGLNQTRLANEVRMSDTFLSEWLNCRRGISPNLIIRIYDFLKRDDRLKFLEDYIPLIILRKEQKEYSVQDLSQLYEQSVIRLREVFLATGNKTKDRILIDLERLIIKLSPPKKD